MCVCVCVLFFFFLLVRSVLPDDRNRVLFFCFNGKCALQAGGETTETLVRSWGVDLVLNEIPPRRHFRWRGGGCSEQKRKTKSRGMFCTRVKKKADRPTRAVYVQEESIQRYRFRRLGTNQQKKKTHRRITTSAAVAKLLGVNEKKEEEET